MKKNLRMKENLKWLKDTNKRAEEIFKPEEENMQGHWVEEKEENLVLRVVAACIIGAGITVLNYVCHKDFLSLATAINIFIILTAFTAFSDSDIKKVWKPL